MTLNDELHRIADRARVADIPDDTWSRARRSRRRSRVAAVVAAAAVIALALGVAGAVRHQGEPPVTNGAPALPARLWDVPPSAELDRAPGLAVGQVAAAFRAGLGDDGTTRIVVVSAGSGLYQSLDLPLYAGRDQANSGGQYLALSPDGSELAYPWTGDPVASGPTPTGMRIVDLETGSSRSIPLTGGQGVLVRNMSWSPDGRWLVWSGQVATAWSSSGRSFGDGVVAGLIGPDETSSTPLPGTRQPDTGISYAVGDDGTVAMLGVHGVTWWRGGEVIDHNGVAPGSHLDTMLTRAALVESHQVLDLRMPTQSGDVPVLARHVRGAPASFSSDELPGSFGFLRPLGFTPAGAALADLQKSGESAAIWRLRLDPDGRATYDQVVTEEDGLLDALTIASALPVRDEVTAPDWVGDGERGTIMTVIYYLGIALLIALGVALTLLMFWTLSKVGFGPDYDASADDIEPDDGTSRGLYWWRKKN